MNDNQQAKEANASKYLIWSARNLGILSSNQLCIQILSFSYLRHPSNSPSSSSFYSNTATALANSLVSRKLDYCNSLYSGISQQISTNCQCIQNSLAHVITNTSKYQHITPTLKKLHWLPIKQKIDYKLCLLTYKTLTNQQHTYLYNSFSFPSHSVCIRSSDSLVLSIPYVWSLLGIRAFSGHGSTTPSWYSKLVFSTNIPFQAQNTLFQNCVPSLGSFPSSLTVYPDSDSCYSHFMPYWMYCILLYCISH